MFVKPLLPGKKAVFFSCNLVFSVGMETESRDFSESAVRARASKSLPASKARRAAMLRNVTTGVMQRARETGRLTRPPLPCVRPCKSYGEWTPAAAHQNSGLLIPRSLTDAAAQDLTSIGEYAEAVARRLPAGQDTLVRARFPFDRSEGAPADLAKLRKTEIIDTFRQALSDFIPEAAVVELIMDDMRSICTAMACLVDGTNSNGLEVKVELMREDVCKFWHVDHFTGRCIVTYCGPSGTTFNNSPAISLDTVRRIHFSGGLVPFSESAQIGDILFIKGAKFAEDSRNRRYD